ncbi:MAG: hypothetical protein COA78_30955 [Blastopirellula sp.]|nr:MAG: hypothetical protein COA78_30955 [Blastopirellula sp.]
MRCLRSLSQLLLIVACCLTPAALSMAQTGLPHIRLTGLVPAGGKIGSTIDLTIRGTDLDEAAQLIFSDAGITAKPKMTAIDELHPTAELVANSFELSIASTVKPGLYEAQVVGRFGISNPRYFMVGTFNELNASGNTSQDKAIEIPLNSTISGKTTKTGVDYYWFNATKGQKINVVCLGLTIDSQVHPQITVADEKGNPVVWSRDYYKGDASLYFVAPENGKYNIALQDHVYGGGDDYFYRLSIHDKAHVTSIYPPVGKASSTAKFTVYGYNLPGGTSVAGEEKPGLQQKEISIALPALAQANRIGLSTPKSFAISSHIHRDISLDPLGLGIAIALSDNPVVIESEPNDAEKSYVLPVGSEYVGKFEPRGDRDFVQFDAEAGKAYEIEVISDRLNSGADPYLVIEKGKKDDQGAITWSKLTEVDDSNTNNYSPYFDARTSDSSYRFTASESIPYRIQLRHLFGDSEGGRHLVYRLQVKQQKPNFDLVAIPAQPNPADKNKFSQGYISLRRSGSVPVTVYVDRQGDFAGDIQLIAENLPQGVTATPVTLTGKNLTATLILTAAADAPAGPQAIQISGKALLDNVEQTRVAKTGDMIWGTASIQNQMPYSRLTNALRVVVIDKESTPGVLHVENSQSLATAIGGKIDFPVKLARVDGFKPEVTLNARGLDGNFKPAAVKIAGDKNEATYSLTLSNAKITPGKYTFYLAGTTKWKYGRNQDAVKKAEADKKTIDQIYAEIKKKEGELNTAKTNAENQVKQTEQKLKEAQQKLQQASSKEENKAELDASQKEVAANEKALAEAKQTVVATDAQVKAQADLIKRADQRKKEIDASIAALKKANTAKDYTIDLISSTIVVNVDSSPIKITAPAELTVTQNDKVDLKVAIERLYGYDDYADITLEAPKGVAGLTLGKGKIDKGKADQTLEIKASDKATPGKHTITVKSTSKWNNVTSTRTAQLVLNVVEKVEEQK